MMLKKEFENLIITVRFKELVYNPFNSEEPIFKNNPVNMYKVTIKNYTTGKSINFPYYDSVHSTKEKPTEYAELVNHILGDIALDIQTTKENYPTFKNFADEFGYDDDSIKALKVYKSCLKLSEKMLSVMTEKQARDIAESVSEY